MTRLALVLALAAVTQLGCLDVLLISAVHETLSDEPPTKAERDECARFLAEHESDSPELFDPRGSLYAERRGCIDVVQRYDKWREEVRAAATDGAP